MKACTRALVLALMATTLAAMTAIAAPKTFTVAPFQVVGSANYKYLEQTASSMLTSRLTWDGHFVQAAKQGTTKAISITDENTADKARATAGADYILWGSITFMGDTCSVDLRVRDKAGKTLSFAKESSINTVINDFRPLADEINSQIFPRSQSAASSKASRSQPRQATQMNPVQKRHDEPARKRFNKSFRYAESTDENARLLSQDLKFASVGMEICDAVGNGTKQVFILGNTVLHAYRFVENGKLEGLGSTDLYATEQALSIRSFDVDHSGRAKLIVNSKTSDEDLMSRVYSFDGKKFTLEATGVGLYLNVVSFPPIFRPQLIAQRANPPRLFMPGISEATVENGKIRLGGKISMPKDFNVFNFAYIPEGASQDNPTKLVMLDQDEHIRLYSEKGARMSTTTDKFSGSPQGIYVDAGMPGSGKEHVTLGDTYYIPMRLLVVDLEGTGNYELIMNKPITTAGQMFKSFRSFQKSEIHSLQWDGMGLSMVWKTPVIKGSVIDYTVTDPYGDGVLALVACANIHPAGAGVGPTKTKVIIFPSGDFIYEGSQDESAR